MPAVSHEKLIYMAIATYVVMAIWVTFIADPLFLMKIIPSWALKKLRRAKRSLGMRLITIGQILAEIPDSAVAD